MRTRIAAVATAAIGAGMLAAVPASAELVSLYGDVDGFGFGAPQDVDGAHFVDDFGGIPMHDYRGPSDFADAPTSDIWDIIDVIGGPWVHEYSLGFTPESATLHMYLAGIANLSPIDLEVDGDVIFTLDYPSQKYITHVVDIDVPVQYIDGSTPFEFVGYFDDGYIMDYARLTIIPAPAALVLLVAAGALARRRR